MSANEILEQFSSEVQEQTLTTNYIPSQVYDDGNDDPLELQLRFKLIEVCDQRHSGHA